MGQAYRLSAIGKPVYRAILMFFLVQGIVPVPVNAEGTDPGRDISGVWVAIAAEPPGGLGPAMPSLAPAGQAMVKDFEDTYGKDAPGSGAYWVSSR